MSISYIPRNERMLGHYLASFYMDFGRVLAIYFGCLIRVPQHLYERILFREGWRLREWSALATFLAVIIGLGVTVKDVMQHQSPWLDLGLVSIVMCSLLAFDIAFLVEDEDDDL